MRSLLTYYAQAVMSAAGGGAGCARNCSDHGDCLNGTCLCEIRYAGDECAGPNMPYHACIGGVFLAVALVCAAQLVTCVVYEYRRLKSPSVVRACKVTTPKMLYLLAFLASLIRGTYFVSPSKFEEGWTATLLSAYYPLLMSGSSLIVCFWAEVFHLRHVNLEGQRFLGKSFLGFVTFNAILYTLLLAEAFVANYADLSLDKKSFYQHIFNGCYAALLFIVVIFFLIYGVEVYFKVRGGFLSQAQARVCGVAPAARAHAAAREPDAGDALVGTEDDGGGAVSRAAVDQSQLKQSRLGLLSQALMLILVVLFLTSESFSGLWKTKVPVNSRNWHDVVFRLAEIGVTLWFPCVLWNCMAPERLWLLNPRRLLSRQLDDAQLAGLARPDKSGDTAETASLVCSSSGDACWICYDTESAEPLMRPCRCTGDVSSVHHSCLNRWLVESGGGAGGADSLRCKVCGAQYVVSEGARVDWARGFTAAHWLRTACVVVALCAVLAAAVFVLQHTEKAGVRVMCVGGGGIFFLVGCKVLGINMAAALQRAKISSLQISEAGAAKAGGAPAKRELATISSHVTVEMVSRQALTEALRGEKQ